MPHEHALASGRMTRNAALLLIARLVSALTTVAVLAVVARTRNAQDLGLVAFGLTVGLALAVIPEGGLTALLIREVARRPEQSNSLLGAVLLTRVASLPAVAAIAWVLLTNAYPAGADAIFLIALGPAIQQIGELARAVLIARGRIFVASAHSMVENIAWLAAVVGGFGAGMDVIPTFLLAGVVLVLVDVAAYAMLAIVLRTGVARPSRGELRELMGQAGPFVGFSTLTFLASRSDTLLIGLLLPNGLAIGGAYFAAARLVAAAEYVPDLVARAIYPDLSRAFVSDAGRIAGLLGPAARQLLAIGIVVLFGLVLLGPWLMTLVYGPGLAQFGWVLAALGGMLPFRYMSIVFGVALTGTDAQARRTAMLAAAVTASIVLQVFLVPRIGVAGAIIGVYVAWIIMAVLSTIAVERRFGRIIHRRDVLLPVGFSVVGLAIGSLVLRTGLPIASPLAGAIYSMVVGVSLLAGRGTSIGRIRGHG